MTSLWILLIPAVGVFAGGVIVGRIISHAAPKPHSDYDTGYRDALHALGWVAGYATAPPSRLQRRQAWRSSWRHAR